jgi:hypothetical protein
MVRMSLPALAFASAALLAGLTAPIQRDAYAAAPRSCWGQATKVFAQLGEMGPHASQQTTPRLGLAGLARSLYEAGVISEPTLQALGAFVASDLGLSIDACM